MANITQQETDLRIALARARSRLTMMDLEIGGADGREYGTALVNAANTILDYAIDISKRTADIERAIANDSCSVLK